MIANSPASTSIHGPVSPSGHWTRTEACSGVSETDVDPAELTAGVTAADGDLVHERALTDPHLHPRSDGVDVGRRLAEPHGDPVAHRCRFVAIAGADVAPHRDRFLAVDDDEVEQPVEVEVDEGAAARPLVADDAGRLGAFDERPVVLAEQEVARITGGVSLLRLDVALGRRTGRGTRRC